MSLLLRPGCDYAQGYGISRPLAAEDVQPPQDSYNPPMDVIHLLVIVVMIAIVASLGNALFHLGKGDSSAKMGRALTVRITLSLVLFLLLMAAWWVGLIHPNQYH